MKRPEGFDEHAGADDRRTGSSAAADRPRKPPRPSRGAGLRAALDGVREARRGSGTPATDEGALRGAGPALDAADGDRVVRRRGDDAVRGTAEQPAGLPELPVVDLTEDDRAVEPTAEPEPAGGPDARVDEGATPGVAPHVPSTTPIGARVRAAETAREARVARKRRRLLERAEVRRFTRRSRHRRAAWTAAGGVVAVLVVSILVAVYSPLMALRTIEVKGTDRVDAAQVRAALSGQLGTPLARIDLDEVQQRIAGFPLIESYVTEEEPPHTLVVTVTERTPVVAVQSGRTFDLVDPAGIVVQSTTKRPGDMPVADIGRAKLGSPVFRTMTEVVLAMPAAVRAQVSGIGASTTDDVTLSMRDGSSVVWGSPDESAAKAELLAALVADHAKRSPDSKVEFDVSAPDNGIIRPRS
ncbi:FtsQ-type POTRA domain-containing protein [Curtobacterium sp. MCBD17_021]|uniref:FtsQ-type POTRA domain-containing protein n=1 Tax=Curtobacterium sp. MCBD17_021 TaxID=2175665 RepID=UPI000DA70856|nr:FtsQ-type POTRA domain-containing protein [Curtobacterium sp. MCBD17_021]PZE68945.1 cell division protein FtsQ [Curtobacterium sp. MCBD17_021]